MPELAAAPLEERADGVIVQVRHADVEMRQFRQRLEPRRRVLGDAAARPQREPLEGRAKRLDDGLDGGECDGGPAQVELGEARARGRDLEDGADAHADPAEPQRAERGTPGDVQERTPFDLRVAEVKLREAGAQQAIRRRLDLLDADGAAEAAQLQRRRRREGGDAVPAVFLIFLAQGHDDAPQV